MSDEYIDRRLNLKNEDRYGQKLQFYERELKVSKGRLSTFETKFEHGCQSVTLVQKEIQTIGDQVQKMNGVGGVNLYPLPLFCNPIAPMKRSCDLNACPLCGMWYICNNFLAVECGHTFHPCYVAMYALSSSKCVVVGCESSFSKQWCATWGIQCCPGIDFSSLTNTLYVGQDNTIPFKHSMFLLFCKLFPFFFKNQFGASQI